MSQSTKHELIFAAILTAVAAWAFSGTPAQPTTAQPTPPAMALIGVAEAIGE